MRSISAGATPRKTRRAFSRSEASMRINTLEKYKWPSVVGLRRLRHPLPAGGSLSTPADPSASVSQSFIANGNLTGSHAKWSLTWLVGYAHDLGQPLKKVTEVTILIQSLGTNNIRTSSMSPTRVGAIFGTFPFYEPSQCIKLLLEPVLGYNSNGTYTKKYTMHEIGASYPKSHRPPFARRRNTC
ncbi:hypothetical protein PENFLA_c008G03624 [Penicillium flavigenum]|uniref:Glutaminase A central domain-containing protein n=1 Tax=Penicillium flavigenum TaxID=254877 RepID=A0A1V6TH21_9EURO|nr:hypothetical protein PENFLA_c008G03624 [Penicillium flavigenum]